MSIAGLQELMAIAITDHGLCNNLLQGTPAAYAHFELSAEEVARLRTITASTLAEYARQAHQLFYGEDPAADALLPATLHLKHRPVERVGG